MTQRNVLSEVVDGVATITMNRPERLNALNYALKDELLAAFGEAAEDGSVRAVVLTGAGRAFCAGADIHDLLLPCFDLDPETREREAVRGFNALTRALRHLENPVVAAVNGPAVGGGCCLALAADVRVASTKASFGLVFIRVGLAAADMGATFLLPRLVGLGCASELLLSGDTVDPERAERIGLVNRVVAPDRLLAESQELAARIAAGPPIGVAMTKRALNRSLGMDIDEHLDYEAYVQSKCMMTEDHREGVEAFLAKREPRFRGR